LLSWHNAAGRVLLHATTAYALDVSDPGREQTYYRPECDELLINAGAPVEPSGVLPHTLPVLAALSDLEAARRCFDESGALHTDESAAATAREPSPE
jgi:hypothetical protein